ncbi:hypothetical protein [Nocardioides sp.]|uniref:hypothetical protein n=1 Tax=Nocardioides sp. TaxID=35761 RepID=UPI002CB6F740|nr:hypothetical protein [Nocardioides sp.]HSX68244.1 hypothetical protein [Nocardioides sp.]
MSDLRALLPLFLLLLVPIWIPIAAALVGALCDRLRPPSISSAQAAVQEAKRRAEAARAAAPRAARVAA